MVLAFVQVFLCSLDKWSEQILRDGLRARTDFRRHGHTRFESDPTLSMRMRLDFILTRAVNVSPNFLSCTASFETSVTTPLSVP